jgi:hypothetical protein
VEQKRKDAYRRKFGDEANQKVLSPVTHVAEGKGIPPFLIVHVADHLETTAQSQRLVNALREVGVSARAYRAKGKNHGTISADLGRTDDEPTKELSAFVRGCLPMGPLSVHPQNARYFRNSARGKLSVEWFHPSTGQTNAGEPVNGGSKSTLKSPFETGDSVVLIQPDRRGPKRSYITRFQLDEDPISEGEKWINGGKDGIDWFNVITKNGVAYGAVTQGDYTDPTAVLTGTWGKNQKVKARVFTRNQTEKYYQEVEIRLRSKIAPHLCTGYEVFWRCLKTPNAYVEIVKWNGKVRDWTSLKKHTGAQYGVKDGDLVEATITGNLIKGFVNGVEVISVTDDTFKEGNPGMGFNYGVGETNDDFGFRSFEVETYDE